MESNLEFSEIGSIGAIADKKPYQLPPEAWTAAHNMRIVDGVPQRLLGKAQVWGTPSVAPHFTLPLSTNMTHWWIYTSLTKAYVWDGTAHTDITRAVGGDYAASNTRDWNAAILGGVPVLNNGTDLPQFWASYSTGTDLADLTNWPSTLRAKVIRTFGPQLVAYNCTKGGSAYPHLVKWSHPADPGSVPSSWDETDPTKDTGENDLSDAESGVILDAWMLGGNMYIFKEGAIWRQRYIGGRYIFAFDSFLETTGILAPRCVCNIGRKKQQVVLSQDDLLVHNGASVDGLLDGKWRRALFNDIDTASYLNSFVFENPMYGEIWVCYPASGASQPNRALIWNYKENALTTADINFRNVGIGADEDADVGNWEVDTLTWEDAEDLWATSDRRRIVVCNTDATKLQALDAGYSNDGTTYSATLQREAIALIGQSRTGQIVVDFKKFKTFKRIWPKITGGPVYIRVGAQKEVNGQVTWQAAKLFDPGTDLYIDVVVAGRALSVEIYSEAATPWSIEGYKVEFNINGNF